MFLKKIPINFYFLIPAFVYYFIFINKGIVIYDEGYYAHIAERILNGQIPYKDFFLQFTPGYFYLLTFFYKLFGTSILTGRILTLGFCLSIVYLTLILIDEFKIEFKLKLVSFLGILAFGFPLINNMSLLAWPAVFLSLLVVYSFVKKKYTLLGIALSLILFTKQNIGIYLFILTNLFLLLSKIRTKKIFLVNSSFLLLTLVWFSFFFLALNSLDKLKELLSFNARYLSVYHFSYPPLNMLFQPTGIFKLLPYYLPIIFFFILIKKWFSKKRNLNWLFFSAVSLLGFFGTVYPTSDLLHVYPFLGLIIVAYLILLNDRNLSKAFRVGSILVLGILIGMGFYLSLFREYYRYQPRYLYQRTKLEIPRAKNIYVDQPLALQLSSLNLFFLINTKKEDPIVCYPFCPMAYFLFERKNPTRFANFYPGYLSEDQENEVLNNLKENKVKFIMTFLEYKFNTPISKFIQGKRKVYQIGEFKVFQIY